MRPVVAIPPQPLPVWLIVRSEAAASPVLSYLVQNQLPPPYEQWTVILEGGVAEPTPHHSIQLIQLAPQCFCCIGLLPLRVTLSRVLQQHRKKPLQRLILEISANAHLNKIIALLKNGAFGEYLLLEQSPISTKISKAKESS